MLWFGPKCFGSGAVSQGTPQTSRENRLHRLHKGFHFSVASHVCPPTEVALVIHDPQHKSNNANKSDGNFPFAVRHGSSSSDDIGSKCHSICSQYRLESKKSTVEAGSLLLVHPSWKGGFNRCLSSSVAALRFGIAWVKVTVLVVPLHQFFFLTEWDCALIVRINK